MLTKNLSFTLVVFIVFALALSTTSYGLGHHTSGGASRREHGDLKRFIKKRAPLPQASNKPTPAPIPVIGAGEAPPDLSATSLSVSTTSVTSSSESSVSSSTSVSTSSISSTSSSVSSSSILTSTSTTTTSSTTSSLSTPTPESSSVVLATTPTSSKSIATLTDTVVAAAATSSAAGKASGASASPAKSTILTVIIAVAASIGGVLLIWTIFRKWKLARSSKFDQRLQPIDWQPTTTDDGIMPTHHRRGSDTSSFHSGAGHGDVTRAGYGATSDSGHAAALGPLPDHDFTAGSNLAPVGGYADLSRGPSPQPQMQETLTRGPSMTKPNYDAAVPLHHQAAYGGRY